MHFIIHRGYGKLFSVLRISRCIFHESYLRDIELYLTLTYCLHSLSPYFVKVRINIQIFEVKLGIKCKN